MIESTVTTPGKLIVSGEYAVLAGAGAIAMAVNRRAVVKVTESSDRCHRVTTPGYADGSWRFRFSEERGTEWLDKPPATGLRLVEEGFAVAINDHGSALKISIDTASFSDRHSGKKYGLGSSAAAMTALVTALSAANSECGDVAKMSLQAHARLQGGVGSGVDIATSCRGGVVEYRMNDLAESSQLAWPDKLACRVLWSGQPAQTVARIRKLDAKQFKNKQWVALVESANNVTGVWRSGEVDEILASLKAYTNTLGEFSVFHELGIFDAGHDTLSELAENHDIVYKPCGAGGGDIGVALGLDDSALAAFCECAAAQGFSELDIDLDPAGIIQTAGAVV